MFPSPKTLRLRLAHSNGSYCKPLRIQKLARIWQDSVMVYANWAILWSLTGVYCSSAVGADMWKVCFGRFGLLNDAGCLRLEEGKSPRTKGT